MATQQNITIQRLMSFCNTLKKASPDISLVCAGGAVRDILNNRPVKDFDFFVQLSADWEKSPGDAAEEIDDLISYWNRVFYSQGLIRETQIVPLHNDGRDSSLASDVSGCDIHSVWHWDHGFNDMPCDIVFVRHEPAKCIDNFDFGICQAYVSGNYGLRTSRAYQRDAFDKRITYVGSDEGRERSRRHLNNFYPKYDGWKVSGITRTVTP